MSVQQDIERELGSNFSPVFLDVTNESSQHNVPPDSETHFRAVVVSDNFEGQRKVARHQQVYKVLSAQLQGPVHALALHTYTPEEWQQRQQAAPDSPDCLGGSKHDSQGGIA